MSMTMTTTLGNSNLRNTSRQTRTNPTRTSKTIGSSLRQNSLIPLPPASTQGANEPHGFYPAITHFADAISALPRDYRRHTSLLKEVDAKAWAPEENLQALITQCLAEKPLPLGPTTIPSAAGSIITAGEDHAVASAANSVVGIPPDNASQYSAHSVDPTAIQRRQLFAALRHNLMQIMVTMDEKNHVISNANEELSRHIRRLDSIYPHIADEISEEARLGSLKHWAYTETNPTKKATAATTRREAAAGLAIMHDTEIAHRSESRREAMLAAKKQRLNQNIESDFDEPRTTARKGASNGKRRAAEVAIEPPALAVTGPAGKRKKTEKTAAGAVGMERSLSAALRGGLPMSREPSQQENPKKRKPPAATSTVARKRLNAGTQDSPKLASSPLTSTFGKDAYKRSPALGNARPVAARARQNSTQTIDSTRVRPSSSASHRNTNGHAVSASTPELKNVAHMTGKSTSEVKNTMKESTNSKGDRLIEDEAGVDGTNGDAPIRGGLLLERSASKQGNTKTEPVTSEDSLAKTVASPRLPAALIISESRGERVGRGRASKTSTPIIGTFAESELAESTSANGNGNGKPKRPARPRAKDIHGLHDSLSPKGLPLKRSHKKGAGLLAQQQHTQRLKEETGTATSASPTDGPVENEEDDEDNGNEDEERYCYCNGVSFGEMVACDNKDCPREWFHLECIGLKSVPKSAKWYCDECKENLARKGKFGSA